MRVRIDGQEVPLTMRVEAIIRFIAEHQAEVEEIPVGKLIVHFKGRSVIPELSKSYRKLKSEEPTDKM